MKRSLMLLLVVVTLLPACQSMPWNKPKEPVAEPLEASSSSAVDTKASYEAPVVPAPGLALSTEQRFKDVPLPMGVKEDLERTFVFEAGNLQVGRMVYTSRASVNELAQFYLRECPTAGWTRQNIMEAENKSIVFTKAGKRLEVMVQSLSAARGIGRGRRLILTLTPDMDGGGGL